MAGIEAITAAKMLEYTTEVAIEPRKETADEKYNDTASVHPIGGAKP